MLSRVTATIAAVVVVVSGLSRSNHFFFPVYVQGSPSSHENSDVVGGEREKCLDI